MRALLTLAVLIVHRILVVHVVPRTGLADWGHMGADFICLGAILFVTDEKK